MRKKGFTIIELIMVVGIILVLIVVLRNNYQNIDKDRLYAEVCVNNFFGDINNFMYSAITNRGLYLDGEFVYPKKYIISFNPRDQIFLKYQDSENNYGIYKEIILSGNDYKDFFCSTDNYNIQITGNNVDIEISKEILVDQAHPMFVINENDQNVFSKTIDIYLCYKNNNECTQVADFTINSANNEINKNIIK